VKGDYTKPSDSKSQINTMNTDKNSYTATQSGTPAQPEQTVSDNTASKCLKDDLLAECHELVRLTQYDAKAGISFWLHISSDCNECGRCTNGAKFIAQKFGGFVAGYEIERTDPHTLVGADAGGHDFAVVGDFIVDWWGWEYEGALETPVLTRAEGIALGKYKAEQDWEIFPPNDFREAANFIIRGSQPLTAEISPGNNTAMTTPNNTPTRSADIAHEGQTAADTNHREKYIVIFILAQRSTGSAIVEASSPEEAQQKASSIDMNDVGDWNVYEDEMSVETVEAVAEGNSHD